MGTEVEQIADLGLVNYVKHPENPDYIVFRFADVNRANDFEKELKKAKIWFERDKDTPRTKTFHLFGIHKRDYTKVTQINYTVESEHRSFLMKNKFLRYFVLFFVLGIVSLSVFGYCKKQSILKEETNKLEQNNN